MSGFFSFRNLTVDRQTRLRGRTVFKVAIGHTLKNKKIFVVPMIAAGVGLASVVWFIGSIVVALFGIQGFGNYAESFVAGLSLYFILFVILLAVTGAISEATVLAMANQILAAEKASIGVSLSTAMKHFPKLLIFALWNVTVGALLKTLERSFIGSFVADLASVAGGLAWAAATYFTLPGVVFENLGPVEATKRGVQTLKEKWGDAAAPAIFASGIVTALSLAGFGLLLSPAWLGALMSTSESMASAMGYAIGGTMLAGFVLVLIGGMLQATTLAFVKMAIYRYVHGQPVAGLDQETLHGAISTSGFALRRRANGTV